MAMSKAEQKAASDRIVIKHPLTVEERQRYEMERRLPEEYVGPTEEKRVCGVCGAEFRDKKDRAGNVVESTLNQFADHQASHNPSPAQWAEAHKRIEAGKNRRAE